MSTRFNVKTIRPDHDFDQFKKNISKTSNSKWKRNFFWLIFFAASFYALFVFVLPKATVTLVLNSEDYQKEYEVVIDQNIDSIDEENLVFPAEIRKISGDIEGTFTATGEKDMGEKAKSEATFYNFTGRSQPLTTKIELIHDSGKVYLLTLNITVPQANVSDLGEIVPGVSTAQVEAFEPGEDYNQPQGRLNISVLTPELQEKIYAETQQEFEGGTSKIVSVVSEEDIEDAKDELSERLRPELKEELAGELKRTDFESLDELIKLEITSEEKSIQLDEEAKEFDLKITAELMGLVFNKKDFQKYLKSKSLVDLPDDKMVSTDDLGQLNFNFDDIDWDEGRVKAEVTVLYKILPQTDFEVLRQEIKGKAQQEARRILMSKENIRDVRFDYSLSLTSRLPRNANKIEIKAGN